MRSVAAALLVCFLQATDPNRTSEDKLWHFRNLGKAFYENPTTQTQAVDEFKRALDLAPSSSREQLNYGLALLRAGKTREGVAQLEKVQKEHPELPHTWFNLGIVWKKEGDFEKALPQFERMVKLTPDEPVAHYNLGVLYKQDNRNDEAVRELQTAVKLNPNLAAPHFQLYNLYRTSSRRDEAAAELAEFQKQKKLQEGSATPEDMEWCDYAEIYDPINALPPQPSAQPKYTARPYALPPGLEPYRDAKAIVPGDYDNDGLLDRAVVTDSAVLLCHNDKTRFTCKELLKGSYESAVWLDYDHDYDLDLFLLGADSKLMRNQGSAGFADHTSDFPFVKGRATGGWQTRVVPDSKAFDLAVNYAGEPVRVVYRDRLNGKYEAEVTPGYPSQPRDPWASYVENGKEFVPVKPPTWISVQLEGVKNMKLAQGAVVEIKAGLLYEKKQYQGVPLLFDLRGYKEADTVRITWPNGLIQNEVRQAANRPYVYKEAQRLSGSCPMIWTWNGTGFQFITDVLGIAPLGASSGDGSYFPVDHDEYVQIPAEALALKDGALELRVTEELSEVSFIDQLRLFAIDHPAAEEVFVNEKWKGPPFPEFRFYGARTRVYPVAARDGAGRDVLAKVLKRDLDYPMAFRRSESGIAELHALTLDFGKAAAGNRAVMVLHGWVDWADGSTFMAAAQESKEGLIPPYLQVRNARGEWTTVIEDMGMPDGKPKTITVDLTGKFLSSSREVRIVTNLCVYWDEIFLSESSDAPELRQTRVATASARTRFRGFSDSKIHPQRTQPEQFFYAKSSPLSYWNPTPGLYTRYGDVRELLEEPDDKYVILGAGDEIQLRFDPSALPPVPSGWRRDYLLKVDGWAKDRDANTAYSQSVEPLPFHAMSSYPYPANEHFPDDPDHRAWREKYNTRPALRLIRSLEPRTSRSEVKP